jgi:hypothetical protein
VAGDSGRGPAWREGNWLLALVAIVAAAIVLGDSFYQGPPHSLPGVALGWALVLYLERAGFVALLIMGVGGVLYRLLTGGQVKGAGGGGLPTVDVEEATKPTEALKDGVDADFKDVNDRLYLVEKRLEELQPPRSQPDREE